jgi:hypothetical protein
MLTLMGIDRRLVELASRRDKALRSIEDYRAGFATRCSTSEIAEIDGGER